MKTIILTAKFGMGHYSASVALKEAILARDPGAQVQILDLFAYAFPTWHKAIYRSYNALIKGGSKLYNCFYNRTERKAGQEQGNNAMPYPHFFLQRLETLIDEEKPDLFFATVPFCAQLVSLYNYTHAKRIPLVTCITDISSHWEWIAPDSDLFLVASPHLAQELIRRKVSPEKILVTGIPVRKAFHTAQGRMAHVPRQILIMGGGLGLLPKDEAFYETLNRLPNTKTTIITGNNQSCYRRLHGRYENIQVIGYTDQVSQYMQQADLLISKPGGITTFEAIRSGLPMLVITPFLQQEIQNAHFIEDNGLGVVLWEKPQNLALEIGQLLSSGSTLHQIQRNMAQFAAQLEPDLFQAILKKLTMERVA